MSNSQNPNDVTAYRIAQEFSKQLRKIIGGANIDIVAHRNKSNPKFICSSHDFCDANGVMSDAFFAVTGRRASIVPGLNTFDSALWNTAWGIARYKSFNF